MRTCAFSIVKSGSRFREATFPRCFTLGLISLLVLFGVGGCGDRESASSTAQGSALRSEISAADILGVRVGMTPDEVREILAKETGLVVEEHRSSKWPVLTLSAKGKNELLVVLFTETTPKAWFVGRSFEIPNGERPLRDDLAQKAVEKYGTPIVRENSSAPLGTRLQWAWDANGEKLKSATSCVTPRHQLSWRPELAMEAPHIFLRSAYNASCGLSVEMYIQGELFDQSKRSFMPSMSSNPEIASGVSATLTSAALYRADPRNPLDVAASREKAKLDEAAKAKTPRL